MFFVLAYIAREDRYKKAIKNMSRSKHPYDFCRKVNSLCNNMRANHFSVGKSSSTSSDVNCPSLKTQSYNLLTESDVGQPSTSNKSFSHIHAWSDNDSELTGSGTNKTASTRISTALESVGETYVADIVDQKFPLAISSTPVPTVTASDADIQSKQPVDITPSCVPLSEIPGSHSSTDSMTPNISLPPPELGATSVNQQSLIQATSTCSVSSIPELSISQHANNSQTTSSARTHSSNSPLPHGIYPNFAPNVSYSKSYGAVLYPRDQPYHPPPPVPNISPNYQQASPSQQYSPHQYSSHQYSPHQYSPYEYSPYQCPSSNYDQTIYQPNISDTGHPETQFNDPVTPFNQTNI